MAICSLKEASRIVDHWLEEIALALRVMLATLFQTVGKSRSSLVSSLSQFYRTIYFSSSRVNYGYLGSECNTRKTRGSLLLGLFGLSALATWYSQDQNKIKLDSQVVGEEAKKLNPEDFVPIQLISNTPYNHNVARLRFAIQSAEQEDFPAVSFVLVKTKDEQGNDVIRPYNPVSGVSAKGYLELMVKKYPNIKGPMRQYPYQPNAKKEIGFVAGGTGITPVYQLIDYILSNPKDHTKITLLYANKTPEDILLKSELDALQRKHSDRLVIHYTVDQPNDHWQGEKGQIQKDMLKKYLPRASHENLIFVCGPPPMMEAISGTKTPDKKQGPLSGLLKELGYSEDNVWKF
ncbi:NADH-cytochrome b5 reductase-like protein [Galdieria sulphuraria]|nr:NADH-cytochrome b5 reductase-like protein [Galdieria sulphuraria]